MLFENLDFSLPRGGIVGIIGPNGAGKTTLFRMMMGLEKPDKGEMKIGSTVKLSPTSIKAATRSIAKKSVYDELSGGQDLIMPSEARR